MSAPAFLSRRGASDTDREAWLAERRVGITATEVASLGAYKTKAARLKAMDALAVEKIEGSSFSGNHYTDWGKAREASLEEWADFVFGFVPESRIAHAKGNRQHLASIDGWRVDDDSVLHLAEYKTSGKPLTWELLIEKGYVDQCLWQMYVTESADATVFWEERLPNPDGPGFVPGVRGTIVVPRDEKRIAVLVAYADEFLAVLSERMKGDDGTANDPMLDDLVTQLQSAKATVAELDPQVRSMLSASGITATKTARWVVSYESGQPRDVLDLERFAEENPAEAEALESLLETKATAFETAFPEEAARLSAILELQATYTKPGPTPNPTLRISQRKDV